MTEAIKPRQFHEADGVEDWRVIFRRPCAYFRTGSFSAGVALVDAIGAAVLATDSPPDVDLRPEGVRVRLAELDASLAGRISAVARALGVPADPTAVQSIQISLDTLVRPDVMPFWQALLGYVEEGDEDLIDSGAFSPPFWFQQMDEPRTERGRFHMDVAVPHDQAEARVAAAVAAGGRLVSDAYAPAWWILADAEGNEACVCTWMGRDSSG